MTKRRGDTKLKGHGQEPGSDGLDQEAGADACDSEPGSGGVWRYEGYELDSGNLVTALVHLYRAEVGRANLWRNRLDATTNWAVVTTAAALTFSFGSPENPHFLLLLVLLLVLTFLQIEARRYSYYALWYYRVRLLETGFFSTMLTPPFEPPFGWGDALSSSLQQPAFITPRWRAAAIRYRRNYIWLVSLVTISWLLKLSVHPVPARTLTTLVTRAGIGQWIPGTWVIGVVAAFYLALLGLTVAANLIPTSRGVPGQPTDYSRAGLEARAPSEEQMAIIITNQKETIAARVMTDLQRGVTAMAGTGMYTGQPRDVLFTAVPAAQEPALRRIVEESDPGAFVIVTAARDIRGRGFAPTEPPT
ncbi:MAG: DUF2270 domain-containing protein [Anaerolineae bacterium]|nr:DUF2270 domain-containing protein [Anaerolineae bacterium]